MPGPNPDFHRYEEPLAVEVEQDGAWWPSSLYARAFIDGEWRGWVDRHVAATHHTSSVPYSRIRRLDENDEVEPDDGAPGRASTGR
jgi:hypothetical protein